MTLSPTILALHRVASEHPTHAKPSDPHCFCGTSGTFHPHRIRTLASERPARIRIGRGPQTGTRGSRTHPSRTQASPTFATGTETIPPGGGTAAGSRRVVVQRTRSYRPRTRILASRPPQGLHGLGVRRAAQPRSPGGSDSSRRCIDHVGDVCGRCSRVAGCVATGTSLASCLVRAPVQSVPQNECGNSQSDRLCREQSGEGEPPTTTMGVCEAISLSAARFSPRRRKRHMEA